MTGRGSLEKGTWNVRGGGAFEGEMEGVMQSLTLSQGLSSSFQYRIIRVVVADCPPSVYCYTQQHPAPSPSPVTVQSPVLSSPAGHNVPTSTKCCGHTEAGGAATSLIMHSAALVNVICIQAYAICFC